MIPKYALRKLVKTYDHALWEFLSATAAVMYNVARFCCFETVAEKYTQSVTTGDVLHADLEDIFHAFFFHSFGGSGV